MLSRRGRWWSNEEKGEFDDEGMRGVSLEEEKGSGAMMTGRPFDCQVASEVQKDWRREGVVPRTQEKAVLPDSSIQQSDATRVKGGGVYILIPSSAGHPLHLLFNPPSHLHPHFLLFDRFFAFAPFSDSVMQ